MSVESVSWAWESSAVRVEKKVVALLARECLPLASPTPSGPAAGLGSGETSADLPFGTPVSGDAGVPIAVDVFDAFVSSGTVFASVVAVAVEDFGCP